MTTTYQIGRSKNNTIKLVAGEGCYQMSLTHNGGQYNTRGSIQYLKDYIGSMLVVGGASFDAVKRKLKLVSGDDILGAKA